MFFHRKRGVARVLPLVLITTLLIGLVVPMVPSNATTNLVKNPGFEMAGPAYWEFNTTNPSNPDFIDEYPASAIHTGIGSVGIRENNSHTAGHAEWYQIGVGPIYPNLIYNLTAWVKLSGYEGMNSLAYFRVDIGIIWQNSIGDTISESFSPKVTVMDTGWAAWTQIFVNATAPTDASQATIVLRASTVYSDIDLDMANVRFDDIELYVVENSPPSHGAYFDPTADPYNEMLQLRITPIDENLTNINFTLQAFGTGDDAADIAEVDLVHDLDGDGIYDNGTEPLLDSGVYPSDDGILHLNTTHTVTYGSSHYILIVYQMTFTGDAGDTFGFNITHIQAYGLTNKTAIDLPGTPITSAIKTLVGSLLAEPGANTPSDHTWTPDGTTVNVLLQLDLTAYCEGFDVSGITLNASGTGHDQQDINTILIYLDANGNGTVDAGDTVLGNATYTADNGTTTVPFSEDLEILKTNTKHLLITYRIDSNTANASTFSLTVTAISVLGSIDASTYVVGLPIDSAIKTIKATAPVLPLELIIGGAVLVVVGVVIILYFRRRP